MPIWTINRSYTGIMIEIQRGQVVPYVRTVTGSWLFAHEADAELAGMRQEIRIARKMAAEVAKAKGLQVYRRRSHQAA